MKKATLADKILHHARATGGCRCTTRAECLERLAEAATKVKTWKDENWRRR